MKPLEVVVEWNNVPKHDPITAMLKSSSLRTLISPLYRNSDNWDGRKAIFRLMANNEQLPEGVKYFE